MTSTVADRVMETTATTGTGPVTTNGAVPQYQAFASAFSNGAIIPYCLLSGDGSNWETGTGILTISGGTTTIQRSAVTSSAGPGVLINLFGTSTIFCDLSASFIENLVSISTVAPIEGGPIGLTGTISLAPMQSGTLLGNGTGAVGAPGTVQIANGLALGEATGFLWNPLLAGPNITLYNGQQSATISGGSNTDSVIAAPMLSAGKIYFELTVANVGENIMVGVAGAGDVTSSYIGSSTLSLGVLVAGSGIGSRGEVFYNGAGVVTWSSGGFNPGLGGTGTFGFAVDLNNELLWCTPDGVNWFGASSSSSGVNPATGAGGLSIAALMTATSGALAPAATISTVLETTTTTVNGGTPWAYTPPSGFGGPTTPQLSLAPVAGASVIGNAGTASAAPVAEPMTTMLDAMVGTYAQGDVLVRNATGWVALAPGTSGQVLATGGTSANAAWASTLPAGFTGVTPTLGDNSTKLATTAFVADMFSVLFGSGSDGAVTISSGTTTLTRDMNYTNLTLSGTGAINTNGFAIRCTGTLDITAAAAGAITSPANSAGTSGSGATGGTGAGAPSIGTTIIHGSNGGNGTTATTAAGGAGGAVTAVSTAAFVGGVGRGGGAGGAGTNAGGAGGSVGSSGTALVIASPLPSLAGSGAAALAAGAGVIVALGGAGGGAGGGDGTNAGGGGGGGGCNGPALQINARTIARGAGTAAGAIAAKGSNGGNGGNSSAGNTGGGGGGGGGSGGFIYILTETLTGATATNALDVSAGNGGTGGNGTGTGIGGTGGIGGNSGNYTVIVLSAATMTLGTPNQTGATGSAGSGTSGGAGGTGRSVQANL